MMATVATEEVHLRTHAGAFRELEKPAGVGGELQGFGAALAQAILGDDDAPVVADGPEAFVESPVGVFAEGEAVLGIVVLAFCPRLDMGGIDDSGAVGGQAAIAGERAGELI